MKKSTSIKPRPLRSTLGARTKGNFEASLAGKNELTATQRRKLLRMQL